MGVPIFIGWWHAGQGVSKRALLTFVEDQCGVGSGGYGLYGVEMEDFDRNGGRGRGGVGLDEDE